MADEKTSQHLIRVKNWIPEDPVILHSFCLLLNEHPHHIGHKEVPQTPCDKLGKAKAKDLLGKVATDKEEQRQAQRIQPHVKGGQPRILGFRDD